MFLNLCVADAVDFFILKNNERVFVAKVEEHLDLIDESAVSDPLVFEHVQAGEVVGMGHDHQGAFSSDQEQVFKDIGLVFSVLSANCSQVKVGLGYLICHVPVNTPGVLVVQLIGDLLSLLNDFDIEGSLTSRDVCSKDDFAISSVRRVLLVEVPVQVEFA